MTDRSGQIHARPQGGVDRSWVVAGALIALAAALRLWLVDLGLPLFDSDEGTMGLMALHIERGARPIFFYGQAYMGALEAYLGAALFGLLGPSDAALRLGLILLDVCFLGCAYALARVLYGHAVALVSLGLLVVGSRELLSRELKAVGGYPELLSLSAAALLGATLLVLRPSARPLWRLCGFGVVGLLAGLDLWSDPLALPFAAVAVLLLATACRRETFGVHGLVLALGLLLGLAPAIAYNTAPSTRLTTWSDVTQIVRSGGSGHAATGSPALERRAAGTVAVSVPVMTGGDGLCMLPPQDAWPLTSRASSHTVMCTAVHAAWGAVYILLLLLAAAMTLVGSLRCRRPLLLARLAPVAGAIGTLAVYMLSSAPAVAPWYDVRYLTGIWLGLPAIVALLWSARRPRAVRLAGRGLLVLFAVALALDAASLLDNRSYASWLQGQQRGLAAALESRGVRHIYTDYWTCDWLAFETRERITCAVLDARLRPSLDRYGPYRAAVRADARAPYVFRIGTAEATAFARRAARAPGLFRVSRSPVFVIYWRTGSIY